MFLIDLIFLLRYVIFFVFLFNRNEYACFQKVVTHKSEDRVKYIHIETSSETGLRETKICFRD